MTDTRLAVLAGAAYAVVPAGAVYDWQDVRAVVTPKLDHGIVVALRGTRPTSMADWIRDAEAWPAATATHHQLGMCHAGFLAGAVGLYGMLREQLAGLRVDVTGHSLGGGLAVLIAAMMAADGHPPDALVTWEAPRAGGPDVRRLLSAHQVRQYRYGDDPVTEVPWLPGLYMHAREPLVAIGHDMPDPLDCHSIAGIIAWMTSHEERQAA